MPPFTLSLILLSSFHVFCSQFAIVTLHAVSCSCARVVRAFLFRWSLMSYFHRFLILFFFSSSLFFPLFSLSFILSFLMLLYSFILSVMVLSHSEPAWCVHIGLAMHLPLESNCYVVLMYYACVVCSHSFNNAFASGKQLLCCIIVLSLRGVFAFV